MGEQTDRNFDQAFGIDIGGSGIKGALVDTTTGALLTSRVRYRDAQARRRPISSPRSWLGSCPKPAGTGVIGATFPAVIKHGVALLGRKRRPELDRHRRRRGVHQGHDRRRDRAQRCRRGRHCRGPLRRRERRVGRRHHAHLRHRYRLRVARRRQARPEHRTRAPRAGRLRRRDARGRLGAGEDTACRTRSGPSACRATWRTWSGCSRPTCSSSAAASARRPRSGCRC